MNYRLIKVSALLVLPLGCSSLAPYDPLDDYVELEPTTVLEAPTADPATVAPERLADVERGKYMVELLGCGSCHTDGAFVGEPDLKRPLAGSRTGIAYTNPLVDRWPGIVFSPNITPDVDTGIGALSDEQIADAIRVGRRPHAGRLSVVMPWRSYGLISDSDIAAIVTYLRNIDPVYHRVPDEVSPGSQTNDPFVYFGVYVDR